MRKNSIPTRIIEALKEHGDATTDVLAKRLGVRSASISSAASRLFRAGEIKRADGKTGAGTEAVWSSAGK